MLLGLFAKACNQIARKVLYLKICRKARGNMGLSKPETGCWKIQQRCLQQICPQNLKYSEKLGA